MQDFCAHCNQPITQVNPGEPTAWLIEGLFLYLTPDESDRLVSAVHDRSAPGSRLASEDSVPTTIIDEAATRPALAEYFEMWKGAGDEGAAGRLRRLGWRTRSHHLADLAAAYGRELAGDPAGAFVSATR